MTKTNHQDAGTTKPISHWVACCAPLVGLAALGYLLWALRFRLDLWPAWRFVILVWIAVASALLGTGAAFRAAALTRELVPLRWARTLVWIAVTLILLWAWFPPMERLVGWWIRQVTMFRFG